MAPAGQAAIVLGVSVRHAATIHDISLRTHYTWGSHGEMTRKLLIAPRHKGGGLSTPKERHVGKRIRPSVDTARLLVPPRRRPGPAQARHGNAVRAAVPVHGNQPDAHRHRGRTRPGPGQRNHQRHPRCRRHPRVPAHRGRARHARPCPYPARALTTASPGHHAPGQRNPGQDRAGLRPAQADHRGPQHRHQRGPRPPRRDRHHPATGPPPRRPGRRGQARGPHHPH